MRKLASIRKINSVELIEGADNLELAKIGGWQTVVKKGEFMPGDLAVYFEIDSFLPVHDQFEFLRKSCFKSTTHLGDGFRIKTVKLRGTLSQGLLLPLSILKGFGYWDHLALKKVSEDDDVTDIIGVHKYELPLSAQLSGSMKGVFPFFIPKTDQERIQNCYFLINKKYRQDEFDCTLKLDGSSMTAYLREGEFGVCSRNVELLETDENTFWRVAKKLDLELRLRAIGRNLAIQGELMGPGIQGNRESLKEHNMYLFDIWDIDNQVYLSREEKIGLLPDLSHVPLIGKIKPFDKTIDELLSMVEIRSIEHPIAEGVVMRCVRDPSISFKVINNAFLLKEKN